jgi:hypothetical protein
LTAVISHLCRIERALGGDPPKLDDGKLIEWGKPDDRK